MNVHKFENSKAQIENHEKGFTAKCECGWTSGLKPTKEEAIVKFENHVRLNSHHKITLEKNTNYSSILLATIGILYIISPIDFVPDYLIGVGWIEDILIGLFCIVFIKKGLEGKSPKEILSGIFG